MLTEAAAQKRREYMRAYRAVNRDKINAYHREWHNRPENRGKREEYTSRYWNKRAQQLDQKEG